MNKNINNRNIIILSSVDWDTHRQLHHELTDYFIKKNNRILFVENTGSRSIQIKDFSRIKNRIYNFIASKRGFKILNKNLTLFTPLFIPFHFNFFIQKINNFFVSNSILNWSKYFNFYDPIIINFVPNPITLSLMKNLKSKLKIYYMADDMTSGIKKRNNIEKKIINISDFIFYTSENLKKKILNKNKHFLPNGVNINKFFKNFKKRSYNAKKPFKIGYVGAIRDILDQKLILSISKKFPKDKIYLLGPILTDCKELKNKKNLIFLGEKKHEEVLFYLKKFNIGIIPYKVNKFTNSINPLKIYEYISAGLPVVSTKISAVKFLLKKQKNLSIFVSESNKQFLNHILKIKNRYRSIDKKTAKKFGYQNSWNNRFNILEKILVNKEEELKNNNEDFIKKIKNFYYYNKIITVKYASYAIIASLLIFNSYFSNVIFKSYSIDFKTVKDNDVVVIFTGFGSRKYSNVDYLNRAKDILFYHKKNNFKNIIVIGRSSKFDEGILLQNVYNEYFDDPLVLIKDSGSSISNILELKEVINKNFQDIETINIISSPIYSRRLDLLLKKNINKENIFLKPSQSFVEEKNLNYFSLIYESIAIIYYKFKNYL